MTASTLEPTAVPTDERECPANPDWCVAHACEGDDCFGDYTYPVGATLDPFFSGMTDTGVEFPGVSLSRQARGGTPGITLVVYQPSYRRGPQQDGTWERERAVCANAPMTLREARAIRDQLSAVLDAIDSEDGR